MYRSFVLAAVIAVMLVTTAACSLAAVYTNTFTNSGSKTWIGFRVECTNAVPDWGSQNVYNVLTPYQKWVIYRYEQGTNFYQRNGFLAYPKDRDTQSLPSGGTLNVTFNYTAVDPLQGVSFTMTPIEWPLDGGMETVTPDNMDSLGWSVATNRNAFAGLVTYGTATFEANRGFVTECENFDLGRGAFYATIDYSGGPGTTGDAQQSATAWLGLDQWKGQPLAGVTLNRITKLKYFGFVSKIPTRTSGGHWDNWNQYWIGPRQPICLELTIENPADPSDRRQLWFRPWQTAKVSGDNCMRQNKRWIYYDCINGQPYIQTRARWYCYRGLSDDGLTSLDEVYGTWSELMAAYGTWKLVATSNTPYPAGYKSAGWDNTTSPQGSPTCSATGKPINFQVGARKGYTNIYGPDFDTDVVNWAGYYWGFKGHVDFFTLGIDGQDVTYNFEPSPEEPSVKAVNINQSIDDHPIMGQMVLDYNNTPVKDYGPVLDYHLVRITGKVVERSNVYFVLDDGSGNNLPIRTYMVRDNNVYYDSAHGYTWPNLGQWWTVYGFLEKTRFKPEEERPWLLWGSYFNMRRIK